MQIKCPQINADFKIKKMLRQAQQPVAELVEARAFNLH
jgi:hypothetical protein